MGWFQEFTPLDTSLQYESLSESEYFNDIVDSLKEYSDKLHELANPEKDLVTVTTIHRPDEVI